MVRRRARPRMHQELTGGYGNPTVPRPRPRPEPPPPGPLDGTPGTSCTLSPVRTPSLLAAASLALLLAACGGSAPAVRPAAPAPVATLHATAPAPSPPPAYANTPLSPFARDATALALAATGGRPRPTTHVRVAPAHGTPAHIRAGTPPPPFTPVAFLLRTVVVLRGDTRALTVGVALGAQGLSLFALEPRQSLGPTRAAADLPAVDATLDRVLGAVAQGQSASYALPAHGEPGLGGSSVTDVLRLAAPSSASLAALGSTLGAHPAVDRLRVEAAAVVARGSDGQLAVIDLRPGSGPRDPVFLADPVVDVAPITPPSGAAQQSLDTE